MLVSLYIPKLGVKDFKGAHYIGGWFIPPPLAEKMNISIPKYEGALQFAKL